MNEVAQRLALQRERLNEAAKQAGRDEAEVTLIAVSKKQSIEKIRAAYEVGQRDFGENYVQELCEKAEALVDLKDIRWHFIGHLQSNKVRNLVGIVARVHTVSSVKLAEELGRRVAQKSPTEARSPQGVRALSQSHHGDTRGATSPLGVLVEVNVGGEASKSGCSPAELGAVLVAIEQQSSLVLRGLMTIPPASDDPEDARPYFQQLMTLRDIHGGPARLPEMSFGMSHDADIAVAVGATFVRIGTSIFGER